MTDAGHDRRRVAVLMTAHNRRDLTLRALASIEAGRDSFDLAVVLFDDGSTDGTGDAVRTAFPETIVLKGDGSAFWNGGMHRAWSHALSLNVDGYLWLNDDVALDFNALSRLCEVWNRHDRQMPVILIGATRNAEGAPSYGGMRWRGSPFALRFERIPLKDYEQPIDTFNGNIVLISAASVDRIGINDPGFFHALGDIDYGLRARRAAIPMLQLAGTLGVCENNAPVDYAQMSMRERLRTISTHRGLPPANWWRVTRRHSGVWFPLHFALAYRRLLFPRRVARHG